MPAESYEMSSQCDGNRTGGRASARPPTPRRNRELLWAVAFLAPAALAILTMRVLPALWAFRSSLETGFPGGVRPTEFAGLENYATLFEDPHFRNTIWQTLIFNVVINPLQIAIALLLAVLLTRRVALRGLWRTMIFVPATVPIVGSSIAWGIALQPKGPVNALLTALGGDLQPFLTSPNQALACIILIASWIGVGYWMVFLIAGIEDIPHEYYEAALVDRAGPVRTFFWVTIPLLKRPLLFVLVADTVANFVLFVPIQLLTNGGPEDSTTMLMFDAYRTTYGFGSNNLGAAEVVILTLIMLVFVSIQFRLLSEEKEAGR